MTPLQSISHIDPSSICDIGANVGWWAKDAHAVWPHASILMIEANPKCEPMLGQSGFPYIIAALGKERDSKTFFMQPGTDTGTGNGFYRENTEFFANPDTIVLDVQTLDELLPGHTFDLIKIDVQGAEMDVLMGGMGILSRTKAVILELALTNYNEGAPLHNFVTGFMRQAGFNNVHHIENIVHPITRELIQVDALFTR